MSIFYCADGFKGAWKKISNYVSVSFSDTNVNFSLLTCLHLHAEKILVLKFTFDGVLLLQSFTCFSLVHPNYLHSHIHILYTCSTTE
jgi:hypothetical protein